MQTETGETVRLRLVGLLKHSIFQSELLVSEANFTAHFPDRSGYGYFLVETDRPGETGALLERRLQDAGLDATPTSARLAHFRTVENTYLSTFQTLGGLGVLLGTIGLGIVMVRNVVERRAELAALRALGFRRALLSGLLCVENGFLMVAGHGNRRCGGDRDNRAPCLRRPAVGVVADHALPYLQRGPGCRYRGGSGCAEDAAVAGVETGRRLRPAR